jgi:D-glycero-alpha-D-manno-heptose-7-phosphate kinase
MENNKKKIITTATPQRISFAGGGTDIDYFFEKHEGLVISSTIDKFIYVTVKEHNPLFVEKYRLNYSITEQVNNLEEIKNEIARECIKFLGIQESLYISTISDLPASSGLASSSCFAVGLLNALHQFKGDHVSIAQIAEEACHIEIDILKKPIGKQDQYAAAFGGINYFNFKKNGKVSAEPIINKNVSKIFENSLLFYTNIQRSADVVLSDQKIEFKNNEQNLIDIKNMTIEFYDVLCEEKFNIIKLAELLHNNWLAKKALSKKISNLEIDNYYNTAILNGALGGKILGAGGGGFLFFLAPQSKHNQIINSLLGLKHVEINFEPVGTRTLLNFS